MDLFKVEKKMQSLLAGNKYVQTVDIAIQALELIEGSTELQNITMMNQLRPKLYLVMQKLTLHMDQVFGLVGLQSFIHFRRYPIRFPRLKLKYTLK